MSCHGEGLARSCISALRCPLCVHSVELCFEVEVHRVGLFDGSRLKVQAVESLNVAFALEAASC